MAALSLPPTSPSSSTPPPSPPFSPSTTAPSPPSPPSPTVHPPGSGSGDKDGHLESSSSNQSPLPRNPNHQTLLNLSFNQDGGCFAASTDRGFRIYNCDPFREMFRRDLGCGVSLVEMLFRCNILAFVGGGPHPRHPPTKVMIWDDHQGSCIGELSFRSEVRAVRLRRDRVVVALDRSVFVYGFADLRLLHQIETVPNPRGLCAVSQQQGAMVLVCPGGQKGHVRVENYGARKTRFVLAHDSRIACLALSQDGAFFATASTKGTLVRVFSSSDGTLLQEVRRGADRAEIHSLAFSSDMQWLAVSSDKGTVHVFDLKVTSGSPGANKCETAPEPIPPSPPISSSLSFIKGVLPRYFHSEWSVAQFRLREGSHCVVTFGHRKNTIVILAMDGSFYQCEFDPVQGGEMKQLECHHFLNPVEIT